MPSRHRPSFALFSLLGLLAGSGCEGKSISTIPCDREEVDEAPPPVSTWLAVTDINISDHYVTAIPTWPAELDVGEWTLREGVEVTAYYCDGGGTAPDDCVITELTTYSGYVQFQLAPLEYGVVLMSWYDDPDLGSPGKPYLDGLVFSDSCDHEEGQQDCYATIPDADGAQHADALAVGVYEDAGLVGSINPLDATATWNEETLSFDVVVQMGAYHDDAVAAVAWLYDPESEEGFRLIGPLP